MLKAMLVVCSWQRSDVWGRVQKQDQDQKQDDDAAQTFHHPSNTLVVHVRLGDVLYNPTCPASCLIGVDPVPSHLSDPDFWSSGGPIVPYFSRHPRSYFFSKKYYESVVLHLIQQEGINNSSFPSFVVLIGDPKHTEHLPALFQKRNFRSRSYPHANEQYMAQIAKFWRQTRSGMKVIERWNQNPDDDFLIGVWSKWFVRGGGGYGGLISHVRKALWKEGGSSDHVEVVGDPNVASLWPPTKNNGVADAAAAVDNKNNNNNRKKNKKRWSWKKDNGK